MTDLPERAYRIYSEEGPFVLVKRGLNFFVQDMSGRIRRFSSNLPPIDDLCFHLSLWKLERRMDSETGLSDVLDTAFNFRGFGKYREIRPLQLRPEFEHFLKEVHEENPSIIVEIGTKFGGSMYAFGRHLNPDKLISIDLPEAEGGPTKRKTRFLHRALNNTETVSVRGNSQSTVLRDEVERLLEGKMIDFLYIDGDHSYEGVKTDYDLYSPLVAKGGIIGFDDLQTHQRDGLDEKTQGVHLLWDELKTKYATTEIIAQSGRDKGMGLLYK